MRAVRTEETAPSAAPPDSQYASKLAASVSTVKVRKGGSPSRALVFVAGALLVLGIPMIILGWVGASRTPYVFEQIPYLISGGLLGLALAVVGGLAYFAYWMTRQIEETRRQSQRQQESLERIAELIAARGLGGGPAASNGSFVATEKGTMFHRRDCSVVAGRTDIRDVGSGNGLEPCKICDPLSAA